MEADLDDVEMRIPAISWFRPATAKTGATLTFFGKGEKGRRVEDLAIKGPGLSIKGSIALGAKAQAGGFREIDLTEIRLSDENLFALNVKETEGETQIVLKGDSFDARPLIRSMFGTRKTGESNGGEAAKDKPLSISLNLDRIYANRGEIITGRFGQPPRARGSRLEAAEISGTFLSGQPVVFRVTPVDRRP